MFEMKNFKNDQPHIFVIFHLKVIVCQNVILPHTYGHHPPKTPICDMTIIKLFIWLTNLF